MSKSYREFFSIPGVLGLVIASLIVRMPQAMISISIITMLVQKNGHYWLAGAVAAAFTLANALIGPQVSKFVDRRGQSKVLPFFTLFSISMLIALLVMTYLQAPAVLLFIFAALAGTMPNMSAMIRARWAEFFRGKPQLHTAFSFDSVLTELTYIFGPPLAIGLSTSVFAEAGVVVAVLLLMIGMLVFLMQRQTEPKVMPHIIDDEDKASSTLRIPGLLTIFFAFMAMGVIGGSVDVAVVAFANEQGWPTAASIILAVYALGSLVAGLVFGGLSISSPIHKQFLVGILFTAATAILPILSPNVYILMVMIFVAGLSFAPTMIIVLNLGTIIIPSSKLTEGLTWMSTGISIGVALGVSVAGQIIDAFGARAAFGVPIMAGLAMVIIALIGLHKIRDAYAKNVQLTH